MDNRVTLAQKLVDNYRTKAIELLVDYLQNKEIRADAEQYVVRHPPSPTRLDTAVEQHQGSIATGSHHRSISQPQGLTHQNISNARHSMYTPPTSAGSVKSLASSVAASGMERIYFLSAENDGPDVPLISRRTTGKHNLIRDTVAYGRGLGEGRSMVNKLVPVYHPSGGQTEVDVTFAVSLTWRRRKETSSNIGTFYIVPASSLDCDVVLGSDELLEHQLPPDIEETHSPQARYQRPFGRVDDHDAAPLLHAHTMPTHAYQQSPIPSPAIQRIFEPVQAMRDNQTMHTVDPSASGAHPKPVDRDQRTHTTAPLATQEGSSSQLWVIGLWDKTPIKMAFDPSDTGEAFYQAFHQWAVRRKRGGDFDRQRMTLFLKANKNMPDEEAYDLGLGVSELEQFWKDAMEWVQENTAPPQIYATVEMTAG